jgi:hypothetical protein
MTRRVPSGDDASHRISRGANGTTADADVGADAGAGPAPGATAGGFAFVSAFVSA